MSEEEQIQMAMQLSIKHTEMKGQDSRKPISTATDDVLSSPLPKHLVQVCITFLLGKMKNSSLRTVLGMPHVANPFFAIICVRNTVERKCTHSILFCKEICVDTHIPAINGPWTTEIVYCKLNPNGLVEHL